MKDTDMATIVDFFDRVIKICKRIQDKVGKQLKEFNPALEKDEEVLALKQEVIVNTILLTLYRNFLRSFIYQELT